MLIRLLVLLSTLFAGAAHALEVQGFVTGSCQTFTGMIVNVADHQVEFIDMQGQHRRLDQDDVSTVFVYNVIDNPIEAFQVDAGALARLKAVYIEDSREARTLAFPVRFIEDLVIFYSLEGKSHVHTLGDIYKLRPAPASALGRHPARTYKKAAFEITETSGRCPAPASTTGAIKPTRVLADKISISDFFHSFEQGYEGLESFQERTYLYARPLLFDQRTRLGLVFQGDREEPVLNAPFYFQWATGEPYRFQSWTVLGMKNHEFLPNTEPVFSIRSDVKSHVFHGLFIGNVAGVPAGQSLFVGNESLKLSKDITVQPSFNYLVMMGGDFGPYSLSLGFFYPDYGMKINDEYREVEGTSPTYTVRAMYTTHDYRLRAITGFTKYKKDKANKDDVLARTGENGEIDSVGNFEFSSTFIRGGIDYTFSARTKASVDAIIVRGNYKEARNSVNSDLNFSKFTVQTSITQSFGNYVSLSAFANVLQNNYDTNFNNKPDKAEQRETRFFGTFEFIF